MVKIFHNRAVETIPLPETALIVGCICHTKLAFHPDALHCFERRNHYEAVLKMGALKIKGITLQNTYEKLVTFLVNLQHYLTCIVSDNHI